MNVHLKTILLFSMCFTAIRHQFVFAQVHARDSSKLEWVEKFVDKPAIPPGGYAAYLRYIRDSIEWPEICLDSGLVWLARLEFIVDSDGSISNLTANVSGDMECPSLTSKIIHLFLSGPNWVPAEKNGTPVRTLRSYNFRLEPNEFK